MINIVEYVEKYGGETFEEYPLNEIDGIILSQVSYLNFENYLPKLSDNKPARLLREIYESPDYEEIFKGYWYYESNKALIKAMVESERFKELKLTNYIAVINEGKDAQFSALSYILPDKSVFIAYRGTDASLLGWKEDLMMGYSKPVRAQELALGYLLDVAAAFSGQFYIGGHSKGGNLAVYAAMKSPKDIQKRLLAVYDYDGPGFRPEIVVNSDLEGIKEVIHKYIPRESVVGILMEDCLDYEVVDCWGIGTLQHNTYTWKCDGRSFCKVSGRSQTKKMTDRAINEWINSLSEEELTIFIDALYYILTVADAKNIFDLIENPSKSLSEVYNAYKDLSEESKSTMMKLLVRLVDIGGELSLLEIGQKGNEIFEIGQEVIEGSQTFFENLQSGMKELGASAESFIYQITHK